MEQQPNPVPAPPTNPAVVAPVPAPAAAPATPAAAPPLPSAPDSWPGAGGAYKYSKAAVKVNLATLVILYVVDLVVATVFGTIFRGPLTSIVVDLLSVLFTLALTLTLIAGLRRVKMSPSQALSASPPLFLRFLGLNLVVGLVAVGSFLLFVVPFFFVFPRLALANYYLVDKKLGIMDAYKASWHATKGHVGKVYGIVGLTLAMVLLMITIIGIPFSIYFLIMYSAANVVLYEFIVAHGPAVAPAAPAVAPTTPVQA